MGSIVSKRTEKDIFEKLNKRSDNTSIVKTLFKDSNIVTCPMCGKRVYWPCYLCTVVKPYIYKNGKKIDDGSPYLAELGLDIRIINNLEKYNIYTLKDLEKALEKHGKISNLSRNLGAEADKIIFELLEKAKSGEIKENNEEKEEVERRLNEYKRTFHLRIKEESEKNERKRLLKPKVKKSIADFSKSI